jgi:plastocyanin
MQSKWAFAIAGAVLLTAIGSAASAATINITIKGFKFAPAAVTAHVGDTIVWTNEDPMAHTATARSGDWDLPIPAGKSASLKVEKAGVFDYFCKIHPSMKATLTVN